MRILCWGCGFFATNGPEMQSINWRTFYLTDLVELSWFHHPRRTTSVQRRLHYLISSSAQKFLQTKTIKLEIFSDVPVCSLEPVYIIPIWLSNTKRISFRDDTASHETAYGGRSLNSERKKRVYCLAQRSKLLVKIVEMSINGHNNLFAQNMRPLVLVSREKNRARKNVLGRTGRLCQWSVAFQNNVNRPLLFSMYINSEYCTMWCKGPIKGGLIGREATQDSWGQKTVKINKTKYKSYFSPGVYVTINI